MFDAELLNSVETAIERTSSAVWKQKDLRTDSQKHLEVKRTELEKNKWAGEALALTKEGCVPKTIVEALKHAAKELFIGTLRGYAIGFMLKGGLNFVFALLKKKTIIEAIKEFCSLDTRQFSRFVGAFIGLFRSANTIAAYRAGKDTPENSAIAGAIASVAMLFDEQSRRQGIALYLFVRAVDVLVKKLVRLGKIPYWKSFEAFMFGVSNIPIMYGFLYEPDILQSGYYKWILGMGNVTHEGLHKTLRVRMAETAKGNITPFCNCSVGYHEGPCLPYIIKDWFWGLGRAGRIYLPVHLIPLLFFRYKALFNTPGNTLLHTFKAFLSSCMFLSTYQSLVKGNCCYWRNKLQRDEPWQGMLSGMLTAFSTGFERKSRVSELMLYCWPRTLEATWIYYKKRGKIKGVDKGEILLFTFGAATLMSCLRKDFKPTYHKALCFLVGS